MQKTKQVLVIRKDLNMRKGKMISQGSHASGAAIFNYGTVSDDGSVLVIPLKTRTNELSAVGQWLLGKFTKITVYVNSEKELLDLHQQVVDAGIICSLIQDSGLTEFKGVPTYTALAVGPDYIEKIDLITGHLPLL